jgi:hypothetical protein
MKPTVNFTKIFHRILFLWLLAFLSFAVYGIEKVTITLKNPYDHSRVDEPIVIKKNLIENAYGKIPDNKGVLVETSSGDIIASQMDDTNNDRDWDELAFLISLAPNQEIKINLKFIDRNNIPEYQQRAHARLAVSREGNNHFVPVEEEERPADHRPQSLPMLYQFEGPGWENDKIAFRSYFDSRNGKDIFGKLTRAMILDSIGLSDRSYHELDRWGMDILKVGNSLGAGALAIKYNNEFYRLGQTSRAHYRLAADGPVRAIIELNYSGWIVDDDTLSLWEQITIWGGKNYYISSVKLTSKSSRKYDLVTGLSMVHLTDENYKPEYLEINKDYSYLAVNDGLSENQDLLAMGVLLNNKYLNGWTQLPDTGSPGQIVKTACAIMKNDTDNLIEYRIFAGWEKADIRFKTEKLLNNLMIEEAKNLCNPIIITN